jgi:tetratricopeptide (TPR) repeat protein
VLFHRSILTLLCLLLAGCRPGAGGGDEQKEPYFLAGKNRLQARNYQAAIEMFEKALDVNPRSASAHFELGILYEQQQGDYAAALYHYQKAVNLRGDMLSADLARQRIQECKRELAKTVLAPVSTQNLQKAVDDLRAENQLLKQQLQTWQAYYSGRNLPTNPLPSASPEPTPSSGSPASLTRSDTPSPTPIVQRTSAPSRTIPPARAALAPSSRLHTVNSGESFASIARRYRISIASLQSANPTIDSRRLRPGQALIIPSP